MGDWVARYAKGLLATGGAVTTVLLDYGNQFCGSFWPVAAGILTTVLVVLVPNKQR